MTAQVVVAENIWGGPYARLAESRPVARINRTPTAPDLAGAEALVVRNRTQVSRELLEACPNLRVVARAGVGLDNIDVDAANDLGVVVIAALGANAVSVAEHTIGLALAVARRTVELDAATRQGEWDRPPGRELAGGVWGMLSAGATARETGRLAHGFGMSVVAYDPYCSPDDAALAGTGIALLPLDKVVRTADVLSIHLPSTPETERMVNAELLAQAKPELILVNVGRGEVVDESALAEALSESHIAGAGLDVRYAEPPGPTPLDALPNVVLTPHVAGITGASQARIAQILCTGIDTVLDGRAAPSAVTQQAHATRVPA